MCGSQGEANGNFDLAWNASVGSLLFEAIFVHTPVSELRTDEPKLKVLPFKKPGLFRAGPGGVVRGERGE